MATIRPSSDLRNNYNEISEFCHQYNEPVFLTKNGKGDLVVLSNAEYERLSGKNAFHSLLDDGLTSMRIGESQPMAEAFTDLERIFADESI